MIRVCTRNATIAAAFCTSTAQQAGPKIPLIAKMCLWSAPTVLGAMLCYRFYPRVVNGDGIDPLFFMITFFGPVD